MKKQKIKVEDWPNIILKEDDSFGYLMLKLGKKDNEMGSDHTLLYKNEVEDLIKKLKKFLII